MPMTSSDLKSAFAVQNLSNSHTSGNVACINYDVFIHESESARGLWRQVSCRKRKTSQGHRRRVYTVNVVGLISRKLCKV